MDIREKLREYQRQWRKQNPGYNRTYYHENKEKYKQYYIRQKEKREAIKNGTYVEPVKEEKQNQPNTKTQRKRPPKRTKMEIYKRKFELRHKRNEKRRLAFLEHLKNIGVIPNE